MRPGVQTPVLPLKKKRRKINTIFHNLSENKELVPIRSMKLLVHQYQT
jgi:hypothetical protein